MSKITGTVHAKETTLIWKVENFSKICTKVGEYIESPYFILEETSSNNVRLKLLLYPFGKNDDCKDYLSLYLLCLFAENVYECEITYGFYIWGRGFNPAEYVYSRVTLTTTDTCVDELKFRQREDKEVQDKLLFWNDTLPIACYIKDIKMSYRYKVNPTRLMESFDALYLSEKYSDLTIEVEDKKLKAHKNILASRSEVFLAMLTHNTIEKNECVIKITDFSYDAMKEVLRFIYCGWVKDIENHKEDLLAVADKYDLKLLKKICEQYICLSMSAENIWEILNIADLYNCTELKVKALTYIIDNLQEVIELPGYKEVSKSNPSVIKEILRETAKMLGSKKVLIMR